MGDSSSRSRRRSPWPGALPGSQHPEPDRVVSISRAGCLLNVLLLLAWAVVTFLPMTVADDLLGPVLKAHWAVWPASTAPFDRPAPTGLDGVDQLDTTIDVPPQSLLTISVEEVSRTFRRDDYQPEMACFTKERGADWAALPVREVPVVEATRPKQEPDTHMVRLHTFHTSTGRLTVRCMGTEILDLRREGPGVQQRLHLAEIGSRAMWFALVILIFWGSSALIRRRRQRRRPPGRRPPYSPPPYLAP